jgi:hypothetical protein
MARIQYEDVVPPDPDRLARARAALAQVEERQEVRPSPTIELPIPETAAERAAVKGRKMPKAEAVLSPAPRLGFDRNAYHKAYMKTYMRAWRARKRPTPP